LSDYLSQLGEPDSEDRLTEPRELKDRVARALTGEVLSAQTLRYFIEAFQMNDVDADRLWSLLIGTRREEREYTPSHRDLAGLRTEIAHTDVGEPDLSSVLRRLAARRRTPESRRKLASSALTQEYLEAGLSLIARHFEAREILDEESGEPGINHPFLDWLSYQDVFDEVGKRGNLRGGQQSFHERWPYRSHYIEDLMSYALWVRHWSRHISTVEESTDSLTHDPDFVRAVHVVAYRDLCMLLDNPEYRISLIAAATSGRDSTASEAMSETYRVVGESWSAVYRKTMEARSLRLRPGVTLDDVTDMLTALADGVGLRLISDPNANLIDHEHQQSLLGKAALAIVVSCVDPGDHNSLEDLARMFTGRLPSPDLARP
jgi:hypothetical protein